MIEWKTGDIFTTSCETIVNTVNCNGVMGKGLALQFKQKFPNMYKEYKFICSPGQHRSLEYGGDIWIYNYIDFYRHKKILCFATKENWWQPSKLEWIEKGLKTFIENYRYWNIENIAWPKLGCQNGGLDWETQVKPLMIKYLEELPIICEIYK